MLARLKAANLLCLLPSLKSAPKTTRSNHNKPLEDTPGKSRVPLAEVRVYVSYTSVHGTDEPLRPLGGAAAAASISHGELVSQQSLYVGRGLRAEQI